MASLTGVGMRSSKELAKRLRFDRYPRGDRLRRWYPAVIAVAVAGGLGLWAALERLQGERPYSPGPVAPSHALFGDQCQRCHAVAFEAVADDSCLQCHGERAHSEHEARTPACRECHVEHRGDLIAAAANQRMCIDCHADLHSRREPPAIATEIASFAAHPQFLPLRQAKDTAALRFNHRRHLTSDKIAAKDQLTCESCHVMDATGRWMQPIAFEAHCQRCHQQSPASVLGGLPPVHDTPAKIREELRAQLLLLAARAPEELFAERPSRLPGIAAHPPLVEAKDLSEFQEKWLAELEETLYRPFEPTEPLLEHNHNCFLCHIESGAREAGAPPDLKETAVPTRWLSRAEFSHRAHGPLECSVCHARAPQSSETTDVNLPDRAICQDCHIDTVQQTAGSDCGLCHRYHDTSKDPVLRQQRRKPVRLDQWRGD